MPDSTKPISRSPRQLHVQEQNWKIKNSEVMVAGGFTALKVGASGGGLVENAEDVAGLLPVGYTSSSALNNATPFTGTNNGDESDSAVTVNGGVVLEGVSVTGVSDDVDIGKAVYATDNQTLTLTRPSDDAAVFGVIIRKRRGSSDAICDVFCFGFEQSALLALAGGNKEAKYLGAVMAADLTDITDNALLIDVQLFGHGFFRKIYAVSFGFDTNWSAGSIICDFQIEGVAIQDNQGTPADATLTLTEASVDAAADRGTTIDLANPIGAASGEFHDGDNFTMRIVNSGSSAMTGTGVHGGWHIWSEIERVLGA